LFFFPYHTAHHPLHSFPTRRSSDLTGTPGTLARRNPSEDPARHHRRHTIRRLIHRPERTAVCRRCPACQLESQRPFVEIRQVVLDRKSTRLNSSHLGISYAVFCLKK